MGAACHSPLPPSSQDTLLQSASHHLSSLLRQILTHPKAQLSESDMQEFPSPTRATHHSLLQDLASEPKICANLPLHPIHKLSPLHSMICTVILACSKVNSLSFKAFITPSIHTTHYLVFLCQSPFHPKFIQTTNIQIF